jgi:hypothetical protein
MPYARRFSYLYIFGVATSVFYVRPLIFVRLELPSPLWAIVERETGETNDLAEWGQVRWGQRGSKIQKGKSSVYLPI